MFTNKASYIVLAYDRRDEYLYEVDFMLSGSEERRGSLRVVYNLTGDYLRKDRDLKFYPLTKNNIEIVKQMKTILKVRNNYKMSKDLFDNPYPKEIRDFSIEEAIEARRKNKDVNLLIFIDDEYKYVQEQDISNRKKNWFFVDGKSINLKNYRFFIDKTIEELFIDKAKEEEEKNTFHLISDIKSEAEKAYRKSLSQSIWSLFLKMDTLLTDNTVTLDIILGKDTFTAEPIEDTRLTEKAIEYLKTKKIWLGGKYLDVEIAKKFFGIDFNLYGLYSDKRDYVYEDYFMEMILHNPKAYKRISEFFKEGK